MLVNRPALKVVLPFVAGILVGWRYDFSPWYLLAGVLLFLLPSGFLAVTNWDSAKPSISVLLFPLIFLVGIFKITLDKGLAEKDQLDGFLGSSDPILVKGVVTDPPHSRGAFSHFIIEAQMIVVRGTEFPVTGSLLVSLQANSISHDLGDSLQYGRVVEFSGILSHPGTARNPGEFDFENYLRLQGIYAQCFLEDSARIKVLGKSGNWLLSEIAYPLRRSIAHYLDETVGGEEAKFLKGLTIGDRSELPPEVKTSFINSGVMHILSVSGLHVALITVILIGVLNAFRIPEKPKAVLLSVFLVFYIFLTGSTPSVVRAVVMAIVVLGARLFERKSDVINSLAFAALMILALDARQVFMPGFQLSFAAVLSIVLIYPKSYSLVQKLPERVRRNPIVKNLAGLTSVSLAAGLGTLPFTSFYFGKIPVVGLVANLVVVPMSGLVLALGITTVTCSFIWSALASLYAEVARLSAAVLLGSVRFFGDLSFSYLDSHFSGWDTVAFYCALLAALNLRWFTMKRLVMSFLVCLNLALYAWLFGMIGAPSPFRVTFLDVGQGDAIFLEFPDGKNMLIDGGQRMFNADAGARFIAPFLKARGISRIDAVVLSHPHSDHAGGLPTVLRQFAIEKIIDAGSFAKSSLVEEYGRVIDSLHVSHVMLNAGKCLDGFTDVRLYVLHPSGPFAVSDSSSRDNLNNRSVVVRAIYGETSALFAGDAEEEAEERMIRIYGGFLKSDLLKVGHHGSLTSSSDEFVDAVSPRAAVISVGRNNRFHHPSEVVLGRFARRRVPTYRTDVDNAVVFVSDGSLWRKEEWR